MAAFDGEQAPLVFAHASAQLHIFFHVDGAMQCFYKTLDLLLGCLRCNCTIYFPAFARCPHLFKPGHALRTVGIIRPPSATDSEIRSAYRRRALSTHPDKGGSPEAFRAVVFAFETLILGSNGESQAWQLLVYHNILSTNSLPVGFPLCAHWPAGACQINLGQAWAEVCIEYDMRHYEGYFIFVCQSLRCVYIQLCIKIFVPTS